MLELERPWVILEGSSINRTGGLAALAEESVNDPVESGALLGSSRVRIERVWSNQHLSLADTFTIER